MVLTLGLLAIGAVLVGFGVFQMASFVGTLLSVLVVAGGIAGGLGFLRYSVQNALLDEIGLATSSESLNLLMNSALGVLAGFLTFKALGTVTTALSGLFALLAGVFVVLLVTGLLGPVLRLVFALAVGEN